LSKTGGNNVKDNIHRTLKKIVTSECSMKCSWKGLRNNFKDGCKFTSYKDYYKYVI